MDVRASTDKILNEDLNVSKSGLKLFGLKSVNKNIHKKVQLNENNVVKLSGKKENFVPSDHSDHIMKRYQICKE